MPNDEQAILELEREVFAAIQKKDTVALEKLLAEDFIFRAPGAEDVGRAAFLVGIRAIPVSIVAVWSDDMKANVYGEFAVLTGIQKAKTLDGDGNEVVSAQIFTDIFQRRSGKWLMTLAYSADHPVT